ncbi:MAG: hypothetical protein SFZ24_10925 [Planctomycetota bacterium]|nr:hypothetical protein [Planctomycetota bacterium]
MAGIALMVLLGVVLALIIVTNLMSYMGGHVAALSRLAERFPPQPAAPEAARSAGQLVMQELPTEEPNPPDPRRPPAGSRVYMFRARVALDSDMLHIALDSGPLGPHREASIPWSALRLTSAQTARHWGQLAAVEAGPFMLALPAHLVKPFLEPEKHDDAVDVEFREVSEDPPR